MKHLFFKSLGGLGVVIGFCFAILGIGKLFSLALPELPYWAASIVFLLCLICFMLVSNALTDFYKHNSK